MHAKMKIKKTWTVAEEARPVRNPCVIRGQHGPAPHASGCRSVGTGRRLAVRPRPLPRHPSDWCFLPPVIGEGVASSRPEAKALSGGQLPARRACALGEEGLDAASLDPGAIAGKSSRGGGNRLRPRNLSLTTEAAHCGVVTILGKMQR